MNTATDEPLRYRYISGREVGGSRAGFSAGPCISRDVRNGVHDIIAPDAFAEEVAHVLTKPERRKIIPVGDAVAHLYDILQNGPTLYPFLPLLPRAVEISSATRIAVTDCIFVALAEREGLRTRHGRYTSDHQSWIAVPDRLPRLAVIPLEEFSRGRS